MHVRWYGQSAFRIRGEEATIAIDPFASIAEGFAARGLQFDYEEIEGLEADLLIVTHEHDDHNGVEAVGGDPHVLRSRAGTFETPAGTVVSVASEHDDVAGSARGANTLVRFELDGVRVCHLGDLGQAALREEQRAALGPVDLLFVPAGGGFTIGGAVAAAVVRDLDPRVVVPMHYRTAALNFLDPAEAFLEAFGAPVERLDGTEFDARDYLGKTAGPVVVMPAAPVAAERATAAAA